MGLLDGRVAFVTGAARGQGRSHALRLAAEGAAVIAIDIAEIVSGHTTYEPATEADLEQTAALLDEVGRPFVVQRADVRDLTALDSSLSDAVGGIRWSPRRGRGQCRYLQLGPVLGDAGGPVGHDA
jgi:NAD(P)-dependent dehydrogenase (short-subunit alcohol dehydrogenase family)